MKILIDIVIAAAIIHPTNPPKNAGGFLAFPSFPTSASPGAIRAHTAFTTWKKRYRTGRKTPGDPTPFLDGNKKKT